MAIAAYRLGFSALFLLPFAFSGLKKAGLELRRADSWLLILSGTFLAVHFLTWIISLRLTSIAISTVLVTTTPIWVTLASILFYRLKASKWFYLGLALAFSGVILIAVQGSGGMSGGLLGLFLALAGAWMAAGYMLVNQKLLHRLHVTQLVFIVYAIAAVLIFVVSLLSGEKLAGFQILTWLWLILSGLIPQTIGHSGLNYSLKRLPAHIVAITLLAEPVLATIMGYLIFKEAPTVITYLSGIAILAGIILAVLSESQRTAQTDS